MARLWSSGAELNSATNGVELTTVNNVTISSSIFKSGAYSFRNNANTSSSEFIYASSAADRETFIRFYIYIADLPSGLVRVLDVNGSLTNRASIRLNADGSLELWNASSQVGSDSSVLNTAQWYRIEIRIKTDNSAGSDILDCRLEGSSFASSSAQSLGAIDRILFGNRNDNTSDLYFDDFGINDTSGSSQNSWPGEGEIIHLRPNASGDIQDWTDGTDETFAELDEVTPDDITTYIGTAGEDTADYNLDATPAALASDDIVNCVQVGVRFNLEATDASARFVVHIKSTSGGTTEESSGIAPTTTWSTNAPATPRNHPLTLYDLPGASTTAWTKSTLDTAHIGVRVSVDPGTEDTRVSTLWLLVDHKPDAAPPSTAVKDMIMSGMIPFAR